jgi:hypothetical protein
MVRQHLISDVQLHIGESLDSGFDAVHRPAMTIWDASVQQKGLPSFLTAGRFSACRKVAAVTRRNAY